MTGKTYKTQAVTGGKLKTCTVIGGGNAVGNQIPPYSIFPGTRVQPGLMEGAATGAKGTVSESGWSNTVVFGEYMKHHVEPILPSRDEKYPLLIIYCCHKETGKGAY